MDDVKLKGIGFLDLASAIAGAYAARKNVPASKLPILFAETEATLAKLCALTAREAGRPLPTVSSRQTVTPDHIISLEDGKPYKMLKRHLAAHGLTPDEYRRKWGLPADYPMVAANYAAHHAKLAKRTGFGQVRRNPTAARKANAALQAGMVAAVRLPLDEEG